ncbi:MAG: hypothetical protein ACI4KL_06765 [Lentihominibacter sp.]
MFDNFDVTAAAAAFDYCVSVLQQSENRKLGILREELNFLESRHFGRLYWRQRGNGYNFWEYSHGRQYGLTKDRNRIYLIARRDYLRLYLSDLRKSCFNEWREALDKLLRSFATAGLDLSRIILTEKQYDWTSHSQSCKPDRKEALRYRTTNGVLVRSKSEQFIGNLLEEFGIPYRYEPELRIGNRIFHPDFVIMTVDGRKIILEHFGRMDLKEYTSAAIDRLMAYSFHGLALDRDVFLSFEPDVRSRDAFIPILYKLLTA